MYVPEYLDVSPDTGDHLLDLAEKVNTNFTDVALLVAEINTVSQFGYYKHEILGGTDISLDGIPSGEIPDGAHAAIIQDTTTLFYQFRWTSAKDPDGFYVVRPVQEFSDKRWELIGQSTHVWHSDRAPGAGDDWLDGVHTLDMWMNGSTLYVCVDNTVGAAIWAVIPRIGTSAGMACAGDDSRLSDARFPTSHSHVGADSIITATDQNDGLASADHISKLDGIETGADVTDVSNVAQAGAVMDTDFAADGVMRRTASGSYGIYPLWTDIAEGSDTRFPTSDQKAALTGGAGNLVTNADSRNTNDRAPTAHSTHDTGLIGTDASVYYDPLTGHSHTGVASKQVSHTSLLAPVGNNTHADVDSHISAASPHSSHVTVGGQIGGTGASPTVLGLRESGGSNLSFGAVADTGIIQCSGSSLISVVCPDVCGGRLAVMSDYSLQWLPYTSNQIMLWNGVGYVLVQPATIPSAANTATDIAGTQLTYDVNYDVFAKYVSATQFDLVFVKWYSSGDGSSARASTWGSGVSYVVGSRVVISSVYYACIQAHTSAAGDQPGSGASWTTYWNLIGAGYVTDTVGFYVDVTGRVVYSQTSAALDGRLYRFLGVVRLYNGSSTAFFRNTVQTRYCSNYMNRLHNVLECSMEVSSYSYTGAIAGRVLNDGVNFVPGKFVSAFTQQVSADYFSIAYISAGGYYQYARLCGTQITNYPFTSIAAYCTEYSCGSGTMYPGYGVFDVWEFGPTAGQTIYVSGYVNQRGVMEILT